MQMALKIANQIKGLAAGLPSGCGKRAVCWCDGRHGDGGAECFDLYRPLPRSQRSCQNAAVIAGAKVRARVLKPVKGNST